MSGEYERSCLQKLGPFIWAPKTKSIFSQKQIHFEEMLVMYEDHLSKENRKGVIFRKVTVRAIGAQTRNENFIRKLERY
jgi:hypothetical protein